MRCRRLLERDNDVAEENGSEEAIMPKLLVALLLWLTLSSNAHFFA